MKNMKLTALLTGISLLGTSLACMPAEEVSAIGFLTKRVDAYLKNPDFVVKEGEQITSRMLYDNGLLVLREVTLYHDLKIDEKYGQEDPCDYWFVENPNKYTPDDYVLSEGENTLMFKGPHDWTFELTVNVTFSEESQKESTFLPGDVNHDGALSEEDRLLINNCQSFIKCDKSDSPIGKDGLVKEDYLIYDFQAADVNQDGYIDFMDEEYLEQIFFEADGSVCVQNPEPGNDSVSVGDINSDGLIDLSDITRLSLVLLENSGDINDTVYDVNADGEVNIADLAHFRQYIMHEDGIKLG